MQSQAPLRILTVSNLYPPVFIGGYELMCRDVMARLTQRGHEVLVLTSDYRAEDAGADEGEGGGQGTDRVTVRRLLKTEEGFGKPRKTTLRDVVRRVRGARANRTVFLREAQAFKPDVVYFWSLLNISRSVVLAARAEGLPVAFHISDAYQFEPDALCRTLVNPAASKPTRFVRRMLIRILTVRGLVELPERLPIRNAAYSCRALMEEARRRGVSQFGSCVIPHGVELETARNILSRRDHYTGDTPLRIMYASRIAPHKGIETLIQALCIVEERRQGRAELTVFNTGEPEYAQKVVQMVEDSSVSGSVSFAGTVTRDALMEGMGRSHVFVLPSRRHDPWFEAWSVSLLEAGAVGMAVIASDSGANPELIEDGRNGLLFDPEDATELADKIESLIDRPEMVKSFGDALAKAIHENYGMKTMVEQVEALLKRAADS